ncbi:hypothetical protein [Shewanella xiamenensis]|uniref:hypothetical protein n=1 Tax=Shewanella xiamenensis TaxID=332186 RepID=UPI002E7AC2F2|nr:hypothetical protein [Shewanella xiamenensis]MEE1981383.1 hypothetical protein [Shewanella xiamenensis]
MDCSYFLSDAGKYTAKRLPTPKGIGIKLKDVTDMSGLRYDLIDYKPQTESQFLDVYNHYFDSIHAYDVEIESFDEVLERSPKLLVDAKELAAYCAELFRIYDQDELVEDYEWLTVSNDFARVLVKSNLATLKDRLEHSDWVSAFSRYNKSELQAMAKPLGIKVSQTKDALVTELVKHQLTHNDLIEAPCLILLKPEIRVFFEGIQRKYIELVERALASFDYPRAFQATVWGEVSSFNEHWAIIYELAKERLADFSDIEGAVEIDKPLVKNSISPSPAAKPLEPLSFTVSMGEPTKDDSLNLIGDGKEIVVYPAITVIFDYADRDGISSSREIKLDKITVNQFNYFEGFCSTRQATRHFRLDRVKGDFVIKDTGEIISKSKFIEHFSVNSKATKNNHHTVKSNIEKSTFAVDTLDRKVSPALGLGIVFFPVIFAWFTLRRGHSSLSRILSFLWLAVICINVISGGNDDLKLNKFISKLETQLNNKPATVFSFGGDNENFCSVSVNHDFFKSQNGEFSNVRRNELQFDMSCNTGGNYYVISSNHDTYAKVKFYGRSETPKTIYANIDAKLTTVDGDSLFVSGSDIAVNLE